ncbi:MAG: AmmeMemoRadiSam system protein A [Bermanella sp.]
MTEEDKKALLQVANLSIQHGLDHQYPSNISVKDYSSPLQQTGASFVTLQLNGELRGCIGSLIAHQPLISDVYEHAHGAAFKDPRFTALSIKEFSNVHIEISILSDMQVIDFKNEEDLLKQLTPGVDGITIENLLHRATFLPQVWESLPEPVNFLHQLKLKAGLNGDHDLLDMKAYRYSVFSIE